MISTYLPTIRIREIVDELAAETFEVDILAFYIPELRPTCNARQNIRSY